MSNLHPSVDTFAAALLRLSALLTEADEAQWQRSKTISPDDSEQNDYAGGSASSRGQHSDPTFDAVSDPARWALRAAVVAAESDLSRSARILDAHTGHIQTALNRWNGGL